MSGWFFPLVLGGLGALFVFGGVQQFRSTRAFLASAHRVPGIVTGTRQEWGADSSYKYYPELRFRTLDGVEVETVGRTTAPTGIGVEMMRGRQVRVLYNPENLREATIDTSSGRGAGNAVVFVVLGVSASSADSPSRCSSYLQGFWPPFTPAGILLRAGTRRTPFLPITRRTPSLGALGSEVRTALGTTRASTEPFASFSAV